MRILRNELSREKKIFFSRNGSAKESASFLVNPLVAAKKTFVVKFAKWIAGIVYI